jgi:hypothetical protein
MLYQNGIDAGVIRPYKFTTGLHKEYDFVPYVN